jgi:hypothetical protein
MLSCYETFYHSHAQLFVHYMSRTFRHNILYTLIFDIYIHVYEGMYQNISLPVLFRPNYSLYIQCLGAPTYTYIFLGRVEHITSYKNLPYFYVAFSSLCNGWEHYVPYRCL